MRNVAAGGAIDEAACRQELECLLDGRHGNFHDALAAGVAGVAEYHRAAVEAIGIILKVPPDPQTNSSMPSCLRMLHAAPARAAQLAAVAGCGGLGHERRERLAAILSDTLPLPSSPDYRGFVDPIGAAAEGQSFLALLLAEGERRLCATAPALWRRVAADRLANAAEVAEELRYIHSQLDDEYLMAHRLLVRDKWELDRLVQEADDCTEGLKTCTPQDFALISLAVHTGEPPADLRYCANAAYEALRDPAAGPPEGEPGWAEVAAAVFGGGGTTFAAGMLLPIRNVQHVPGGREARVARHLSRVRVELLRDSGCAALDALHAWCRGASAYLQQLAVMAPRQGIIRTHTHKVATFKQQAGHSRARLRVLAAAQEEEAAGHEAMCLPGAVPRAGGAGRLGAAAAHTAEFLGGWSSHDVSGMPLTEAQLRELFERCDVDGSGAIDRAEFARFYKQLEHFGVEETDRRIDAMLKEHKVLDDGKVTFDEFSILMLHLTSR